jgi:hypothetical protein
MWFPFEVFWRVCRLHKLERTRPPTLVEELLKGNVKPENHERIVMGHNWWIISGMNNQEYAHILSIQV